MEIYWTICQSPGRPATPADYWSNTITKTRSFAPTPPHSSGAVWESRWTSWAVRPNEPSGFRGRKELFEPCFGIGHNLSLICQLTSEDIKQHFTTTTPPPIVQELCETESQGGRPGLSVLNSLLVSVDLKNYQTVLRHWSQLVPNMSTDIWGH